jgi:uncharacterized membrane protein HdeD (DUF308 family)
MERAECSVRPPAWMRMLRIGIGVISIVLSLVTIAYPGLALETAVVVISIILLIIGIEHIAEGILLYRTTVQLI